MSLWMYPLIGIIHSAVFLLWIARTEGEITWGEVFVSGMILVIWPVADIMTPVLLFVSWVQLGGLERVVWKRKGPSLSNKSARSKSRWSG